eukprot:CAMPEP_0201538356 /NCGR_PEP_ID=MMETSP0161_2-20130828/67352_1 /ASSEMBLY_ACC=CAM_ASM_000251 /TAXON_ID=180227 /ORGANISM="Neoparamoeba aestuarina, Strain SoJaBio B1-5/56/2" /LENGTH=333 /DNA_ID=CAMNT_0047945147 /DNA_START=31 /DNA_END=1028 /DNA_ORIENTATION=-
MGVAHGKKKKKEPPDLLNITGKCNKYYDFVLAGVYGQTWKDRFAFLNQLGYLYAENALLESGYDVQIHHQVRRSIEDLLRETRRENLPLRHPQNETLLFATSGMVGEGVGWQAEVMVLQALWGEENVQKLVERREKEDVEGLRYLMDNLGRFAAPGYSPTSDDIFRSQVGVCSLAFQEIGGKYCQLCLPEVQDSERDGSSVIYFHSLDVYGNPNMRLVDVENAVTESLRDFHMHKMMALGGEEDNLFIFLVLTKKDLFLKNIEQSTDTLARMDPATYTDITDINTNTTDNNDHLRYRGGRNYETAIEFIKNMFVSAVGQQVAEVFVINSCGSG